MFIITFLFDYDAVGVPVESPFLNREAKDTKVPAYLALSPVMSDFSRGGILCSEFKKAIDDIVYNSLVSFPGTALACIKQPGGQSYSESSSISSLLSLEVIFSLKLKFIFVLVDLSRCFTELSTTNVISL
jgi:hypothetical protein